MALAALGASMSCQGKAGCINTDGTPFGGGIISLADPSQYTTKITGVIDDIGSFGLGGATSMAAGDLNGDGIPDLVLGASGADFNNRTGSGAVHVRFGTAAFATGDVDLGPVANSSFHVHGAFAGGTQTVGSAVAVGDLNGDGIGDLVIGDASADNNTRVNSGSVYVIFGGAGVAGSIGFQVGPSAVRDLADGSQFNARFDGIIAGDGTGFAVAVADLNGDGIGDLVMSSPTADPLARADAGRVDVVFGGATFPTGVNDLLTFAADVDYLGGTAGDGLGAALSVGQLGGSAVADVVMGAPGADGPADARVDCGEVYVVFGGAAIALGAIDLSVAANFSAGAIGATAGDGIGRSLAIGDVNGAANDLVIGAPTSNRVEVLFGPAPLGVFRDLSGVPSDITYTGAAAGDGLGTSVAVGDHDTNAGQDVVLGAPGHDTGGANAGAVYVVSGGPGIALGVRNVVATSGNFETRYDGAVAGDALGASVLMTQINGDAQLDLLMGGPGGEFTPAGFVPRTDCGIVWGRTAAGPSAGVENIVSVGTAGEIQVRWLGSARGAGFDTLFSAADVNGDGILDTIWASSKEDRNGRKDSGTVYVLFGKASLAMSQELSVETTAGYDVRIDGAAVADGLGGRLLGMGDINGDGIDEIIVGSFGADNNARPSSGSVYVLFGRTVWTQTIWDLSAAGGFDLRFDGATTGDVLGFTYTVGDLNNDGIGDLAMTALLTDFNARADSGSLYVMYGRATWPTPTVDLATTFDARFDGAVAGDGSGVSPAIGDLDGDGRNDLAIGAPFADFNAKPASGSLYLRYGRTAAPAGALDLADPSVYDVRLDGETATGDQMGFVNFIGDFDGDGLMDVTFGALGRDSGALVNAGAGYLIYGGLRIPPGNYDQGVAPLFDFRVLGAAANATLVSLSFVRFMRPDFRDMMISTPALGSVFLLQGWNNRFSGTVDLTLPVSFTVRFDATHPTNQMTAARPMRTSSDVTGDDRDDVLLIESLGDGAAWDGGALFVVAKK